MLVAAFRATLEEVIEADVILHVRDMSHDGFEAQSHDVEKVLGELGIAAADRRADRGLEQDRLSRCGGAGEGAQSGGAPTAGSPAGPVSALTGEGMDHLLTAIEVRLGESRQTIDSVARPRRRRGLELALSPFRGVDERLGERWPACRHCAGGCRQRGAGAGEIHIRLKFYFSAAFASSQSASISASVASFGVLPRAASARSIDAKRRSNFRLVSRKTPSGSASR